MDFLYAMQGQGDLGADPGPLVPELVSPFLEQTGPDPDVGQRLVPGVLDVAAQAHAHQERPDVRVGLHEEVASHVDAGLQRPAGRKFARQPGHSLHRVSHVFKFRDLVVDQLQRGRDVLQAVLEHVVDERFELGHPLLHRLHRCRRRRRSSRRHLLICYSLLHT